MITGPPIPDAPALPPVPDANLPPWVLAYAEYDGRAVRVIDTAVLHEHCTCPPLPRSRPHVPRFLVGAGEFETGPHGPACPAEGLVLPVVLETKDRIEALAEYEKQAELLCHRDALAGQEGDD